MTLRPRSNRSVYVCLAALAALIAITYLPLARTHAGNAGATILPSTGKPLVNLKAAQALKFTYTGDSGAVGALERGTAVPTALAAADFNHDGAMDIVAGYSTGSSGKLGGALAIFHGNRDAFAPADHSLYGKAILQGKVPPTFLSTASAFSLPESPDLLATGDFNGDGNQDVLVAARGSSNLYLLRGDGNGNLLAAQTIPLHGQVRAFAATDDGHVAVSIDGADASELYILAPGKAGSTTLASYPLPASGNSVAWGNMGGSLDVAVGAGANVVLVYSPLSAKAQTESVPVPFQVQGVTVGNFIWDRDGRSEIAALADDGSIHILQHGTLNTTPVTAAELPARRAAIRGHHATPTTSFNPTSLGAWTLAKQVAYTGSAPSGPVSPSAFNSPRLTSSSTQDLMVLDAGASQLHILDTSGKAASPSADVAFANPPVAALALPQKINSDRDIVVLTSGRVAPMQVTREASITLNVTTTADNDPNNNCTTSSTSQPNPLSLRAAVCIANNTGDTATINVPEGTYDLTSLDTGELQQGVTGTGSNVSYSLTINGTGTASATLIQGNTAGDRILEEDFNLQGNNPVVLENLTLQDATCTNNTTEDCTDGGGAVIAGGITGDDLTLTNVVMNNNAANPSGALSGGGQDNGGAVSFETPADLTITSSTFTNNSSSGAGGAIEFLVNGSGSISITNSTFSNNTSGTDPADNVGTEGGALDLNGLGTGVSATISGSTFTGNEAIGLAGGGAIYGGDDGTFSVSNSRFYGNTASGTEDAGSGGVSVDGSTVATLTDNWWGCNAGPGNTGCDSVYAEPPPGNGPPGATANFNPWLVLSISANPTEIQTGGTSTLTADLTHDSNGNGGFSVPDGTPVSFGGTLDSSVNPASTTTTNGQATSTYTAGSTPGNGTGTATVDSQEVSTGVDILDSVTVTTSPGNLAITVDGTPYTAPQTFSWVVGSSHTIATSSPQAGPAGTQYAWTNWSDGGAISHTISVPSSATTYTAFFATQYQLTISANPPAGGTVTPTSGNYYNSGTVVPISATAAGGYTFVNWTSSPDSVANPTSPSTTITMNNSETVTANFQAYATAVPTNTSVGSSVNPSFTTAPNNTTTLTATVTYNGGTPVTNGTVTFTANGNAIANGSSVPLNGSGQAQVSTSFTMEGTENIVASYSGYNSVSMSFLSSSGNTSQEVDNHTVQNGNQFCNPNGPTLTASAGAATPYPSKIFVTGVSGNISAVTVNLNNISSSDVQLTDLLLVGPTGAELIPFASVGDGSTISGVNITLDDSASSLLPGGSPLTSGTFKPTSLTGGTSLLFPAPAPSTNASDYAATDGSATLTSQFGSTAPNGTWELFAMATGANSSTIFNGGWCVNITTGPPQYALTTAVNPAGSGTVTPASGSTYTQGTVVPISATAAAGYAFVNWTSSPGSVANPTSPSTTITMNANETVTANFTAATISISPPTANFGTVYISTRSKIVETITNVGSSPVSISGISIIPGTADPSEYQFVRYCGAMLKPHTSCEVSVVFFGDQVGTQTATLNIADNAPGSPQQVPLTANVIDPIGQLSPSPVNFGAVAVHGSATLPVTLTNTGLTTLDISNVAIGGANGGEFAYNASACPATLGPSDYCTIQVTFNPTKKGSATAKLTVSDNTQKGTTTATLEGKGD